MAERSFAPGEIAIRGEAIYRERIHKLVDPVERGSFVVIDVETSDYQVDASDVIATRRLLNRCPSAMTYAVRVGHVAAYRHSGGSRSPETLWNESVSEDRHALVTLEIVDTESRPCPVEVVLDTGFTGYLTLPPETVRQLGLSSVGLRTLELGSGDLTECEAYLATVSMQGALTDVLVLSSDGAPMVGMSLLRGSRIALHAIADGDNEIKELKAGLSDTKPITTKGKRFLVGLRGFVKKLLFSAPFVSVVILSMIVAFAFGVLSLPLNFGEILTFLGIWVTLGALLGQNKPPSMPLRQYLPRRLIGFVCVYGLFAAVAIVYTARVAREAEAISGAEFWGMLVLSLVGFAVGFFAGQDKEKKR